MRYPASEKLEIIRLVEESHLSDRLTLAKLGIPRTTFYRWYDRYLQRGEAGLQDQSPKPKHVWNRIPNEVRREVVKLALKAHDLITSPAFIVIKAASEFKDKTTGINQLLLSGMQACPAGQGVRPTSPISRFSPSHRRKRRLPGKRWGWFYLSTILDDYSRYIISWKLCTNMRAEDVTDTLDLALQASGCDQVHVVHKPRLLSDNGSSYVSGGLAEWLQDKGMKHSRGAPYHPQTQGKIERWHQTMKNLSLIHI